MANSNTAEIGFENKIWSAACILRGNMDAAEYKQVVLGLIFLKYLSDKFDLKYRELVENGEGFEEDCDEYLADNLFFVPPQARWSVISAGAHTPEIGQLIDNAMIQIEKENPRLKGILPKNFSRSELDKRRLGDVVDLFTNIAMAEHGDTRDILGKTYEYCLSKFAEQEGKLAGSEVMQEATCLNRAPAVLPGAAAGLELPCALTGGEGVSLEVLKKAEKSDDLIIRLVETDGRNSAAELRIPANRKLVETNLLEWTNGSSLKAKNGAVEVKLKPFEIKTFKVK